MQNLKAITKFIDATNRSVRALIIVPILLLAPVLILGWLWFPHVNERIEETKKELHGLRLLHPILKSTSDLAGYVQAEWPATEELKVLRSTLAREFDADVEFDGFIHLLERAKGNSDLAFSAAAQLIHKIGNSSKLHFDGDQTTYNLSTILLHRIPALMQSSKHVLIGVQLESNSPKIDPQLRSNILLQLGILSTNRSLFIEAYRNAIDGSTNHERLTRFEGRSVNLSGTVDHFSSIVQTAIGYGGDMAASEAAIKDLKRLVARLHNEANELSIVSFDTLASLLESRLGALQTERNLTLLLSIVAVAMGLILVLLIIRDLTNQYDNEIVYLAHHDELTGIANRKQFNISLDYHLQRVKRGAKVAVLYLDLDRFKIVNDTLGHPIGDRLLKVVSEKLRNNTRSTDILGRLGGDEFSIIQVDLESEEDAGTLAGRLIEVISEPCDIDGHRIEIGASVGIAIASNSSDQVLDADHLIRQADMALYRSKAEGRGTFRYFAQDMDDRMQARRTLERDLKSAIEEEQFELHYQPLVSLSSRQIIGFEALIRWQHPTRGRISPDQFIPLSEETGLIVPIGNWVLNKACQEAVGWPSGIRLAVNLSSVQLEDPRLIETIDRTLETTGLDPQRLDIEITESVAISHGEVTRVVLSEIRKRGIKISMDDFGTGYTSLGVLQTMPFDHIKIDKSLISNISLYPERAAIIRAISEMAGALGMQTTAEGIETYDELRVAERNGCGEAQGYLFSKPCPPEEIQRLLKQFSSFAAA